MKAILMSISSQWVAKILNGEKTIEIRKMFPSDYVGWVYIYATKGKKLLFDKEQQIYFVGTHNASLERHSDDTDVYMNTAYELNCDNLTGKVVARFWCDKVERLYEYQVDGYGSEYEIASDTLKQEELLKECCLTYDQLSDYLGDINNGKAIHITNLEIFDKPKEISEFYHHFKLKRCESLFGNNNIEIDSNTHGLRQPIRNGYEYVYPLTRAPQSYCFIEV